MAFAFGDYELDVAAYELRHCGEPVAVQPKVFDTLRYLIERRGQIVSKEELLDALWGGGNVNRVAVPWSISHARKALGQRGGDAVPIETVRGRGYRFVSEVRRVTQPPPSSRGVLDAGGTPVPEARARRGGEPFLGREDVMDRLSNALNETRTGRGRLVLLTGEAGIGKTRCANEMASAARRSGLSVWVGRCAGGGGVPSFWPWIQILRACTDDSRVSTPDRKAAEGMLARLAPATATEGDSGRPAALSESSRFWLSEALVRALRQAASHRPRLLVIDDLHAADEGSLEAFALLAPELAHAKILVIATARDGAGVDSVISKALPARIRECEVIALSGLTFHDVERYIDDTVGYAVPKDLARAVFAKTAGNPLFLREAVRLVASRAEGRAELRPQDVELPEVARELLRDRVGTLDPEVRQVLEAASVIGEEFELSVLRRVVPCEPPERLLSHLDAAVHARFVEPRQDAHVYAFTHALIREALSDALPATERVKLHKSTADALRAAAGVDPRTAAIAYHLHHALPEAPPEDVARFSRMAGDDAARVFAYSDAAQFYGWALAAQDYGGSPDARVTCEVLLASAAALRWVGRTPEARQQCAQAIELAQRESFADLLVEVARSLRPTVWLATIADPLVLGALEESLRLLPESATTRRAQAYSLLSTIPPHSLDCRVAGELADKALGLARELGDHALEMEAMVASLHSLSGPDSTDALFARVDEILKLDGPPISWWSAEAFFARYNALLQRGDARGAQRALEAFGECARLMRLPEAIWQYERVRAQASANAGDFDRAEARFNELLANSSPFQASATYQYAAHMNALSWARHDRPLPFASLVVIGGSPDVAWKWAAGIPQYEAERMLGLVDVGDARGAAAAFEDLVGVDLRHVTRDGSYLYVLAKLSLVARALSDPRRARMLYDALLPYADRCAVSGFSVSLGSVAHYLGALASFLGMRGDARRHFEHALEDNVRFGQPAHAARTRAALAELDREGSLSSAQPAAHSAHQP